MSSSSDIAVRVTGLSKKYRKGEYAHHSHVIDAIKGLNPFRSKEARMAAEAEHTKLDFWALKDVSFEIPKGEVLGVIGRNGAGKSTLLKILSQITPPTEGRVEVRGRLGALLEVGTGFHPDLTGRENIFLNGAIMGMTRSEIKAEFDSIVDFSGVEEFIDTPVKRYSSGMYTRLAFSVAAHLRNEVLIVDEVLAVGDFDFQKKCLGKMHDVSKDGRTILFVSHQMESMAKLSTRVMHMEHGRVKEYSLDVRGTINRYIVGENAESKSSWRPQENQKFEGPFKPSGFAVVGADGKPLAAGICQGDVVEVKIEGETDGSDLSFGYYLYNDDGVCLWDGWCRASLDLNGGWKGMGAVLLPLHTEQLNVGKYRVELAVVSKGSEWIYQLGTNSFSVYFEVTLLGANNRRRVRGPGILSGITTGGRMVSTPE